MGSAEEPLDKLLGRCQALGLLRPGDSSVPTRYTSLPRSASSIGQPSWRKPSAALNAVATVATSDWLQAVTLLAWYERL